jgi:hypothetical protein
VTLPLGRGGLRSLIAACAILGAAPMRGANAQTSSVPAPESRRVDGVVMHGEPKGPRAIGGVRVVLHRVGSDRAGPLDSALTDARGRYAFRYVTSGSPDAVYFVSASFDGIAYFTVPLRDGVTRGDDALITVFDTTSGPVPIHVIGHHVIIGAPDAQGRREAVEVFELGNDSSVTRVSGGPSRPVWTTVLPNGITGAKVNPTGEIAPTAVSFTDGRVRLFAPISPGARQLSYAYQVPKGALPLTIPIDQPTSVLEVLLEEPKATVSGAPVGEVAPTSTGGRSFRRFLGQNVPERAMLRIDVPFTLGDARTRFLITVFVICGVAMLGAMVTAMRRRRAASPAAVESPPALTAALLHEIAALDAEFEREPAPTADTRAAYAAERARLKSRLAAALADEQPVG